MPTRVVAQSGATAVVANMDDVDGEAYRCLLQQPALSAV